MSRLLSALVFLLATPAVLGAEPKVKEVTFDDIKLELMKDEPFEQSDLTEKVKELDGKLIRIRGYILPSFEATGIKQFVLVRDNKECCFGPGAALHDCIVVQMVDPATTEYTTTPVSAEGTFSIREIRDGKGTCLAIYRLECWRVK